MSSYPTLLTGLLLYFLFPVWLIAGFTDYVCHRRTSIETTSGFTESLLHVVQAVQLGIALFIGLFLEINALTLLLMIGAVLAHSATAFWDVRYTAPRRYISPLEQYVHGLLEFIPIVATSIVVVLYWDQIAGLIASGHSRPSFSLQFKQDSLPGGALLVVLCLTAAVQGLPLAEEFWRTSRMQMSRLVPKK
jgi:hypothetical protein